MSDAYWVPHDWPGHRLDITRMRNPVAYRAECACGEWMDTVLLDLALRWCADHKRNRGGMVRKRRR